MVPSCDHIHLLIVLILVFCSVVQYWYCMSYTINTAVLVLSILIVPCTTLSATAAAVPQQLLAVTSIIGPYRCVFCTATWKMRRAVSLCLTLPLHWVHVPKQGREGGIACPSLSCPPFPALLPPTVKLSLYPGMRFTGTGFRLANGSRTRLMY